jgi:hypothetical protein
MKLLRDIKGATEHKAYAAVASVIKLDYIAMAKKYKDKNLDIVVSKLCESIDKRDREHYHEYADEFNKMRLSIETALRTNNKPLVCEHPKCNSNATHINISTKNHMVLCDEHYKEREKLFNKRI